MNVGTLLDPVERKAVVGRLRRVTPETKPSWGKLDAPRMLCHLADQMRAAVGDLPTRPVGNFLHRTLLKWVVVETGFKAPPGKVMTAPEMLSSTPTSWDQDLAACEALIARVGAGEAHAAHPTFGPLSTEQWGRLCWKHLDHHLRQFGQ